MSAKTTYIQRTLSFQTTSRVDKAERSALAQRLSRLFYQDDSILDCALLEIRTFRNTSIERMREKEQDLVINTFKQLEEVFSISFDFAIFAADKNN